MLYRSLISTLALAGALCFTAAGASAWDDSKYPDFSGQWRPIGGPGRAPPLLGYSIGHWIDPTGAGRYDVLEAEPRGFRGPRAYDATGLPLHHDNQTVIKERFYIDRQDPTIAHDEVTVIDHALTQPWTVVKNYRRNPSPHPAWNEENCPETNNHIRVGKDDYMVSGDGLLMPTEKGQRAPDLRYFK